MDIKCKVDALEQYASDNYEVGGHWVYETSSFKYYLEALQRNGFDLAKTKDYIRRDWELAEMQCRECSSGEDWSNF